MNDFQVRSRGFRIHDVASVNLHGVSAVRTAGVPGCDEDLVRLYVVRRGTWTLGGLRDLDEHDVSAGQFFFRHFGQAPSFETTPRTTASILYLPTPALAPLLRGRSASGPADSAELRLLLAHTNMLQENMSGLSPVGVRTAYNVLVELAGAVLLGRFDDVEPLLAPALAQAAKGIVDRRLADPELSTTMLARELHVSPRTLQRAFAVAGESVTAYIRHQRLERARNVLNTPFTRLSVSQLAAHWHFTDSSHFIRAFKKQYGQTPAEYARSRRSGTAS